jgi:hypothetical protein
MQPRGQFSLGNSGIFGQLHILSYLAFFLTLFVGFWLGFGIATFAAMCKKSDAECQPPKDPEP